MFRKGKEFQEGVKHYRYLKKAEIHANNELKAEFQ